MNGFIPLHVYKPSLHSAGFGTETSSLLDAGERRRYVRLMAVKESSSVHCWALWRMPLEAVYEFYKY